MKHFTIGIDCRLFGSDYAGIGRYEKNTIPFLIKQKPKNIRYILFFRNKKQLKELKQKLKTNESDFLYKIVDIQHYSLKEQLILPFIYFKYKLDLLYVPHFNVPLLYFKKTIVTIHDLLWYEKKGFGVSTVPKLLYPIKYFFYRLTIFFTIKKSLKIIVPSFFVKKSIEKFFRKSSSKVIVVYEGVEKFCTRAIYKKDSDYLIYVGSTYPHKNLEIVFKALENLNFKLYIVTARDIFTKYIKNKIIDLGIEKKVKIFYKLEDHQLCELMKNSFALIQPSTYEGFGLTGVEAMSIGIPVLASNIQVFKEIYKDVPFYFDKNDHNSLIKAILELKNIDKKSLSSKLDKGLKLSASYNWDKCAKTIYNILYEHTK